MDDPNHEDGEVAPILSAGSSLIECKPVFSNDSKWLICGCGAVIKVYSVSSGECVQVLKGHKKRVTALCLSPYNPYQLLSCGLDNCLIKWNYADGIKLRTFSISTHLVHLVPVQSKNLNLLGVRHLVKKDTFDLVSIHLPEKDSDHVNVKVLEGRDIVVDRKGMVAVGGQNHFIATATPQVMTVCPLSKKMKDNSKRYKPGNSCQFTCLACHPVEHCVATGTSRGQVILWWGVLSNKMAQTVYHWHALPVLSLAFTAEGSYLLSGGHECVLVKWQTNTQDKDTLPRLGSPIVNIVASKTNTLYATCHADNSIQVMSSSLRVIQIVQGLTRRHLVDHGGSTPLIPVGLQIDPRTGCVVTNGRPGHLQFYSLNTDKQLYNLDIVNQNYISPENLQRPLVVTEVERAAFSPCGTWLATVQRRDDKETTPEMALKFWLFRGETQMYELNTTVDLPHTDAVVTLTFRTGEEEGQLPMVVTTSTDGKFKLWQLVDDTDIYRTNQCWSCESVGFYRNLPAGPAYFSEDGSLLAVGFHSTLTLWDPDSNGLKTSLTHGTDNGVIRHIVFGLGSCSHLLVCTTETHVYVWNLLSCSVEWFKAAVVTALVRDSCSENMAYITKKNNLAVFTPSKVEPIFKYKNVSSSNVISAVFMPHQRENSDISMEGELGWQKRSQLFMLNSNQELLSIVKSSTESDADLQIAQSIAEKIPESQLSSILKSQHKKGFHSDHSDRKHHSQINLARTEFIKQILETPAHVLPPVSSLCAAFLGPLILPSKITAPKAAEDDVSDDEDFSKKKDIEESDSDVEMEDKINTQMSTDKEIVDTKEESSKTNQDFCLESLESLTLSSTSPKKLSKLEKMSFSWMNDL